MNEIICPNCQKAFKVDESGFADILKQVRDHQFEEEISNRLALAEKEKVSAVKLAEANIQNNWQVQFSKKEQELVNLKAEKALELQQKLAEKENLVSELKAKIDNAELVKTLAVNEATKQIEKERDDLNNSVQMKETENLNGRMVQILKEATDLTTSKIKLKLLPPSDVYLTAEELIQFNVADHIL
jgi:hypothetical protein